MINILLICLFVIVPIILIFCNLYLVVFFQNPEEKHMNWPCRILVMIALELLECSILLLPADVINKGPPYGEFPMDIIWIVVYYVAGDQIPFMVSLGAWNFAIGFGAMVAGLVMSMRWR